METPKKRQTGRPKRSAASVAQTRKQIAAVALRLFHQEGSASVSMRRLAQEAGCSPMTIYAHFDGKIDILQYLWADVLDDLFGRIREPQHEEQLRALPLRPIVPLLGLL